MQVLDEALLGRPFFSSASLFCLYVFAFSRPSPLLPSALYSFYFIFWFLSLYRLSFSIPCSSFSPTFIESDLERDSYPYIPWDRHLVQSELAPCLGRMETPTVLLFGQKSIPCQWCLSSRQGRVMRVRETNQIPWVPWVDNAVLNLACVRRLIFSFAGGLLCFQRKKTMNGIEKQRRFQIGAAMFQFSPRGFNMF